MASKADIVSYMDVDLSTNLEHFIDIVDSIVSGKYKLGIGSRLKKGAIVKRSLKRQILSVGYNILLKILFIPKFTDAQCGFKAVSRRVVREIIPLLCERGWLFDTELLAHVAAKHWKIQSVPVDWVDGRHGKRRSAIHAWRDGLDFIFGVWRIRSRNT